MIASARRRVCFVTGPRAEFGLMRSTLEAIRAHPALELQLVVTGMHLDRRHGKSVDAIRGDGWTVDAVVPWRASSSNPAATAVATGKAMAGLAEAFERLRTDVVLVVGDRVEAFAAAAAGHVAQKIVAHVHGGDRALGQVDDALRHAITKLAHVHFPATAGSAERIVRLGEVKWRVHRVGSPGIDGIRASAASRGDVRRLVPDLAGPFALVVQHPVDANPEVEHRRARLLHVATRQGGFERLVVIGPNNDPGSTGIVRYWNDHAGDAGVSYHPDLPRPVFLGLLRDAAVLVGNSSSGIIEAASFGTPVVNVGPRQDGRERSGNVTDVPYGQSAIRRAVVAVYNGGRPRRWRGRNVYGGDGAGGRIADILGRMDLADTRLLRKLIAY